MTKMNTLEMTAGNVFHLQEFEQNKIKSKQRSFEDFIGTSFVLIDADLLLIWMNNFQLCFCFHLASCLVLPAVLIISREEYSFKVILFMPTLYTILSRKKWKCQTHLY